TSYGFPTPRCSSAIPPRRPLRSSPGSRPPAARRRGSRARSSNRRLSPANLCSPSTRASLRANRARKERRSTGRGNPVDEIANAPFDFAARQAVARLYVRQAEIAADDEGAQPLTGQGGGALNAEAAHRLHGRPAADAIENRARHVVQAARLEQGAIGLTRIVLQVDADAVHPGGEHVALVGSIYAFGIGRGLYADNPARGVKKAPVRKVERYLSEAEIARLAEALDAE